jgi:hypothetical protein
MENKYQRVAEKVFFKHYKKGAQRVDFTREEMLEIARQLNASPKNPGDLLYALRFRIDLPEKIRKVTPKGKEWLIKLSGKAKYAFVLEDQLILKPNESLTFTKILDSTPGIIRKYALSDEQALLAILRYNRLIDTFLGLTCYPLQSHLRTSVEDIGQIETDEIYIGIDKRGAHYIVPVQAKGGKDRQGKVQIEQDLIMCSKKFASLLCISIAAQFMDDGKIALMSFEKSTDDQIRILSERHYKLVPAEDLLEEEVQMYNLRSG